MRYKVLGRTGLEEASALPVEYPGWFLKQFDAI
jgi:hypothetical protein